MHDHFLSYSESLIDVSLFYILNGMFNTNPRVRYSSLYILSLYVKTNLNFFYNFQNSILKLSKGDDLDSLLLIIKIIVGFSSLLYKNKILAGKRYSPNEEEAATQVYLQDLSICNRIIISIITRLQGDQIFIFKCCSIISSALLDNLELSKTFIQSVFHISEANYRFILYEEPLEKSFKGLLESKPSRLKADLVSFRDWNKPVLLKAYDCMLKERSVTKLGKRDYDFIQFLISDGLNLAHCEIYKSHFKFSSFLIDDLSYIEKCENALNIIKVFLFFEPISKTIFDECYENLTLKLTSLSKEPENKKVKDLMVETLRNWIKNSSQILREGLKKLLEILGPIKE